MEYSCGKSPNNVIFIEIKIDRVVSFSPVIVFTLINKVVGKVRRRGTAYRGFADQWFGFQEILQGYCKDFLDFRCKGLENGTLFDASQKRVDHQLKR